MPDRSALPSLSTLIGSAAGNALPLPPRLRRLYGSLRMPTPPSKPLVYSNFVSTLDGVVSLQVRGHSGGGDISGFSRQDRMVMGLLRAAADAVVVGSGTLDADPQHLWTPQAIFPDLAPEYCRLRGAMRIAPTPLNVIVSARGDLDLRLPVFSSGRVDTLIITSRTGAKRLAKQPRQPSLLIRTAPQAGGGIAPKSILTAIGLVKPCRRILLEGGPRLLASFYAAGLADEQFLTLAPQISGRDEREPRLSLVMGRTFAPRNPLWGRIVDVRRGENLLFLRLSFRRGPASKAAASRAMLSHRRV